MLDKGLLNLVIFVIFLVFVLMAYHVGEVQGFQKGQRFTIRKSQKYYTPLEKQPKKKQKRKIKMDRSRKG